MTLTGLHLNDVRQQEAGLIIEACRRVNLSGCTILNCDNGGLLLKDCVNSRVSDCLIFNDKPDAKSWKSLVVTGGQNNMIVDNLLGVPPQIDPKAIHIGGNDGRP